ncbi:MAG: trypsin-like peptidase domain-containing protein [Candidatus Melainabacteria bacterium]|jgi:serine protease Do|nr:trypsin-like peptidase domain-containing protein [Candidatus Melainabacteria bacterium]
MKNASRLVLITSLASSALSIYLVAEAMLRPAAPPSRDEKQAQGSRLPQFSKVSFEGDPPSEGGKSSIARILAISSESAVKKRSAVPLSSETIADIAEIAAPSVVNIEVKKTEESSGSALPLFDAFPFGDVHDFFYYNGRRIVPDSPDMSKLIPKSIKKRAVQTGTGFVVREDGYVMTNAHVVKNAQDIRVTLNDKRSFTAKIVGSDNYSDLALLKIEANGLPVLKMGTSLDLRPGEFAIAIGSPFGYDHTVTLGIISAVGRTVDDINGNINFIQTDAAINPGNSGGPLLNMQGEVVGVNTAIKDNAQNIGFSIPVDVAKTVADDLINNRTIERPWLGIGMSELKESQIKSLGIPATTRGVLVEKVFKGSPSEEADIQPGDIIQKIDGKSVLTPRDVQTMVRAHKVKDKLAFLLLREGAIKTTEVIIGAYPDYVEMRNLSPNTSPNLSPNLNPNNAPSQPQRLQEKQGAGQNSRR